MRRLLPATILALAFVVPAFAQDADIDHPDLTGTWVLNIAKSKFNKHVKPSPNVDITCGVYAAEIDESIDGKRHVFVYTPDGEPYLVERVPGGQIMSKAYWKNGSLVTELWGVQTTPGEAGRSAATMLDQTQRWSLSTDGKVLTREIDGGKEVLVYDLQQDDSADCEVPDFSGTWMLNLAKSKLLGAEVRPVTLLITCSGPDVNIRFESNGTESTLKYVADGKEREVGFWQELNRKFAKTSWVGSDLVTVTVQRSLSATPEPVQHLTERWTLSSDGRTLTQSFDEWKSLTRVYEKQPPVPSQ